MNQVRDQKISFKVTREEKEIIDARVKLLGQNRADYIRTLVLDDAEETVNYSKSKKSYAYVNLITAINNIPEKECRCDVIVRLEEFVCL